MKFPSLSSLSDKAGRSFLRFPLAILLAIAGMTISIFLLNAENHFDDALLARCGNGIVSCYLGMLLSVATTVWAERKGWGRKVAAGAQLAVLGLTVLYFFLMSDHFEEKTVIR